MKIFRYSTHGYLLTLVLSFFQEGHGKLAPQRKFFKCLNAPRFNSQLIAASMFPIVFETQIATFYRIECVSLNILSWNEVYADYSHFSDRVELVKMADASD